MHGGYACYAAYNELHATRHGVCYRSKNRFPMPLDATSKDDVFVGRIRRDISLPGDKNICLFVCGDQIKKGAALNAVQIAELLV